MVPILTNLAVAALAETAARLTKNPCTQVQWRKLAIERAGDAAADIIAGGFVLLTAPHPEHNTARHLSAPGPSGADYRQ